MDERPESCETCVDNYRVAIERLVTGYNKSVVLNSVTNHALDILDESMTAIDRSLSSVVTAFEEIRATSDSTATNADRIDAMMKGILSGNSSMGEGISRRVDEVGRAAADAKLIAANFTDIRDKGKAVADLTGSIRDVADRTGILAINASIEAARAGSVGKGFRIIANEVRTLAGQTTAFADSIEQNIATFEDSVAAMDERMRGFLALLDGFGESFAEILENFRSNSDSVGQAGEFLTQIVGAIREETLALSEGLNSLERISTSVKDTHAVFGALTRSHRFLDTLLEKAE